MASLRFKTVSHIVKMRNRPDITYLTILGLSLTVVLAVCKEDARLRSGKLMFDSVGNPHICHFSADSITEAFRNALGADTDFVYADNIIILKNVIASSEVIIDIRSFFKNEKRFSGSYLESVVCSDDHEFGSNPWGILFEINESIYSGEATKSGVAKNSPAISIDALYCFAIRAGPAVA